MKLFGLILSIVLISPISYGVNMSDCEQLMLEKRFKDQEKPSGKNYYVSPALNITVSEILSVKPSESILEIRMPLPALNSELDGEVQLFYKENFHEQVEQYLQVRESDVEQILITIDQLSVEQALESLNIKYYKIGGYFNMDEFSNVQTSTSYFLPLSFQRVKLSSKIFQGELIFNIKAKNENILTQAQVQLQKSIEELENKLN